MSGAVINAGDFLIEKRAIQLLKHFIPEAQISILNRVKIDYSDKIDYLNSFDGIVFAGGPIYSPDIYPKSIPFVNDLTKISPPVIFMGGGCWSNIYNSHLTTDSKSFFLLGCKHKIPLGCRDWYTYRFLKNQGFSDIIMTGCPAWYDLDNINKLQIKKAGTIKKICISEPANNYNIGLLNQLVYWLRSNFKDASLNLVIHREEKTQIESLKEKWKDEIDLNTIFIPGSSDGFNIYNDADLHIGFRVHAHIYNLSRRNFSILINEDIRGKGVNHALGLESIDVNYDYNIIRKKRIIKDYYLCQLSQKRIDNKIKQINDVIDFHIKTNFKNYEEAFAKMKYYYKYMENHIQMINNFL